MDSFVWLAARKKLPGKHGQQALIAAPPASAKTSNPLSNRYFLNWHGFRCGYGEPRLGRAFRFASSATSLGGPRADHLKGRTTDGEYASRRTFAADDAGTADGCRRQQRRERQHQRLQGRQVAVFRISELGRARRQLRRPLPHRQL